MSFFNKFVNYITPVFKKQPVSVKTLGSLPKIADIPIISSISTPEMTKLKQLQAAASNPRAQALISRLQPSDLSKAPSISQLSQLKSVNPAQILELSSGLPTKLPISSTQLSELKQGPHKSASWLPSFLQSTQIPKVSQVSQIPQQTPLLSQFLSSITQQKAASTRNYGDNLAKNSTTPAASASMPVVQNSHANPAVIPTVANVSKPANVIQPENKSNVSNVPKNAAITGEGTIVSLDPSPSNLKIATAGNAKPATNAKNAIQPANYVNTPTVIKPVANTIINPNNGVKTPLPPSVLNAKYNSLVANARAPPTEAETCTSHGGSFNSGFCHFDSGDQKTAEETEMQNYGQYTNTKAQNGLNGGWSTIPKELSGFDKSNQWANNLDYVPDNCVKNARRGFIRGNFYLA